MYPIAQSKNFFLLTFCSPNVTNMTFWKIYLCFFIKNSDLSKFCEISLIALIFGRWLWNKLGTFISWLWQCTEHKRCKVFNLFENSTFLKFYSLLSVKICQKHLRKKLLFALKKKPCCPWFLSEPTRCQTLNSLHQKWNEKFFRGHWCITRISQLSFNLQIGHFEHNIFIEACQL